MLFVRPSAVNCGQGLKRKYKRGVPSLPPENVEFAQAVVYEEYRVDTHTNLGV